MHLGLSPDHKLADPNLADEAAPASFRVVLHHDLINPKQKTPVWSIEEAEIRMVQILPGGTSRISTQSAVPLTTLGNQSRVGSHPSSLAGVSSQSGLFPVEIQDLCEKLRSIQSTQCGACLGYLIGGSNNDRHGIYWPDKRLLDPTSLSVETMTSILKQSSHPGRKLTEADARRLAVPLAAGILRLHNTPWLDQSWDRRKISIIRRNGQLLSDHPFASQTFKSAGPAASIGSRATVADCVIRNKTLFALGLTLIEMCMDKSMYELHIPSELNIDGTKHDLSDLQTASRLLELEEVSNRFGQRWSNVVRRCIYCDLNQIRTNLDNIGFQQAVYDGVFVELEEERRQFFQLE
jgi:hypothetical protein